MFQLWKLFRDKRLKEIHQNINVDFLCKEFFPTCSLNSYVLITVVYIPFKNLKKNIKKTNMGII